MDRMGKFEQDVKDYLEEMDKIHNIDKMLEESTKLIEILQEDELNDFGNIRTTNEFLAKLKFLVAEAICKKAK